MKKRVAKILFVTLMITGLFSGCSGLSKDTIIPEDIINKALSAYDSSKSYYTESALKVYEGGEITEESVIKDWTGNFEGMIKKRVETESEETGKMITTNDGKELLMFMEKENKITKMTVENGIDGAMGDYKQQFLRELSVISKTHEVKYDGREKVNGFEAIHLHGTPKKSESIIGSIDYWIDENSWFIVKTTSEMGDMKVEMSCIKLEFSDKFDEALFTQNIPDGVEIEDLDENPGFSDMEIDMDEAEAIAGKPILVVKKDSEYTLKNISSFFFEKLNRTEINQSYEKDGADAFLLTTIIYDKSADSEEISMIFIASLQFL